MTNRATPWPRHSLRRPSSGRASKRHGIPRRYLRFDDTREPWQSERDLDEVSLKRDYADLADVVVVEPRSMRRVIKGHLLAQGHTVSTVVPHTRCYALARVDLQKLEVEGDLNLRVDPMQETVLLLGNPTRRGSSLRERQACHEALRRSAFHGAVHLLLEERTRSGQLDEKVVLERIVQLGHTEFEEVRAALEQDDLLLRPDDDLEVYREFCAVFLELHFFAPELIVTTFPGIEDHNDVLSLLSLDLDLVALRKRCGQEKVLHAPGPPSTARNPEQVGGATSSPKSAQKALRRAQSARKKGKDALCILLCARAEKCRDSDNHKRASELLEESVRRLTDRLQGALGGNDPSEPLSLGGTESSRFEPLPSFREVLLLLAERGARSTRPRSSVAFVVLRLLERAADAFETPGYIVDVPSWLFSWGKRPAVRPRDKTHTLFVVRHIESARDAAATLDLSKEQRLRVDKLLGYASAQAHAQVRATLRGRVQAAMDSVGMRPLSGPEKQGQRALIEWLLDQVLERGFISLSQLRDGIADSEFKLPDLRGARELRRGDPLLRLDERLSRELDGIYRRGDIYLRWLQKLSSLAFGTTVGRILSLWLLLPALGAFTLVEGFVLIAGPLLEWLGTSPFHFNWTAFALTATALLALLHSEAARVVLRMGVEGLGWVLSGIFFRIPRALVGGLAVQRLLSRPGFRAFTRVVVVPSSLASVTYLVSPYPGQSSLRWALTATTFLMLSLVMGSRVGWWLEDFYIEQVAPAWSTLSRQWLPSLFRAINRTFFVAMDALDRGIHKVAELLRFRRSLSTFGIVLAGGAGLVWAFISYVIRLYVTLLVEPEVNPVKHFPVVTVAHKLMLPFLPDLLVAVERPLSILGPLFGGALAGITVFLLPSVFGFLAWEFKADYRLYRRTRSQFVEPAHFGPHGESCRELLVEGLHSGTVPKLHERLRRAAERDGELSARGQKALGRRSHHRSEAGRFAQGLKQVERCLRRLVERQLLPPLCAAPRFPAQDLVLSRITISSNRLKIKLSSEQFQSAGALEITIEQLGGYLVASLSREGFLPQLSNDARHVFENTLAVFYHRARIDLVREQLESQLGDLPYEVHDDGLLVRLERHIVRFDLDTYFRKRLKARGRGSAKKRVPPLLAELVLYNRQRIHFRDWEQVYQRAASDDLSVPRLVAGPSLLRAHPSHELAQ